MVSMISPDSRDTFNPAQNLKFERGASPQKGSPAKATGQILYALRRNIFRKC
jgi:hypothetical protein